MKTNVFSLLICEGAATYLEVWGLPCKFDVSYVSGVAGSLATVLHDAVMNPAEGNIYLYCLNTDSELHKFTQWITFVVR